MRIAIVTGGTGGHIYPALALVEALKAEDAEHQFLFIGNAERMEATVIPQAGYAFKALHTKGLQGHLLQQLFAVYTMVRDVPKALKYLKSFNPDWVIGFGGYVGVPVILAARLLKIKTMIHEQNAIVGKANRFLSLFVDAIATSYPQTLNAFPAHKTRVLGNPRTYLFRKNPDRMASFKALNLDPNRPTLLWVMGSLGSETLNDHVIQLAERLESLSIQMICVTGPKHYEDMISKMDETRHIRIVPHVDQVAWMSLVELMITRGGATTAAEIMMSGVPAIIIPSPYVPNNHQFHNAKALFDANAAMMLEEKDVEVDHLLKIITELLYQPKRLESMRRAALTLAKPNAAQDIIQWLKEWA